MSVSKHPSSPREEVTLAPGSLSAAWSGQAASAEHSSVPRPSPAPWLSLDPCSLTGSLLDSRGLPTSFLFFNCDFSTFYLLFELVCQYVWRSCRDFGWDYVNGWGASLGILTSSLPVHEDGTSVYLFGSSLISFTSRNFQHVSPTHTSLGFYLSVRVLGIIIHGLFKVFMFLIFHGQHA